MSNRYISHYFYRASWTIDLIAIAVISGALFTNERHNLFYREVRRTVVFFMGRLEMDA
jgi:hypothetical protein